jgi:hypothetical protein
MSAAPRRRLALLIAGGGTLVALSYALAPEGGGAAAGVELVASAARGAAPAAVPAAAAPVLGAPARGPISAGPSGDPFALLSFVPAPPPPPPPPKEVPPPPPPPPTAPPLPFSFVGLVEKGAGRPQAFLARGDALHVVGVGDVIEDRYRVESLSPTSVVLTYLPLSERQVLNANGGPQ